MKIKRGQCNLYSLPGKGFTKPYAQSHTVQRAQFTGTVLRKARKSALRERIEIEITRSIGLHRSSYPVGFSLLRLSSLMYRISSSHQWWMHDIPQCMHIVVLFVWFSYIYSDFAGGVSVPIEKKLIVLEPIATNISHSTYTYRASYRTPIVICAVCSFAPPILAIWPKWHVQPVRSTLNHNFFNRAGKFVMLWLISWMMWIWIAGLNNKCQPCNIVFHATNYMMQYYDSAMEWLNVNEIHVTQSTIYS